jgi:hypothetical protein
MSAAAGHEQSLAEVGSLGEDVVQCGQAHAAEDAYLGLALPTMQKGAAEKMDAFFGEMSQLKAAQ